ncbi:Predicted ABC-type ATPase [Ruminococcus sp. YRD2003]|uniref:zeta toxin family protein n=1 Tax=Ruminococcus sp. YRD2003 TaxID=1452313 RepID=UPI0008B0EE34|nr:Predicted ABC-type ATPase [Ruminococcus flavefaciens]
MSVRKAIDNEKEFTIVAGVNGAGKSTFIEWYTSDENKLGRIIDADKLAREHGSLIAGGRKALEEIDFCIENGINFCQETTLSGKQIIRTIKKAKAHGYRVEIIYLGLDTIEEHIARVAKRVSEGGHDIPEDVIRRRFASRFECLCRILPLCDGGTLGRFENSFDYVALYFGGKLYDFNLNDRRWIKEFYSYYIEYGGEMWNSPDVGEL